MQATAPSLQLHLHDDRLIPDRVLFPFPPMEKRAGQMSPLAGPCARMGGVATHRPLRARKHRPPAVPISGMRPQFRILFTGKDDGRGVIRGLAASTPGVVAAERDRPVPDFPAVAVVGRCALPAAGSGGRAYCGRGPRGAARTTTPGRTRAPCTVDAAAGRRRGEWHSVLGSLFSPACGSGMEQNNAASLSGAERGTTRWPEPPGPGPRRRDPFSPCAAS
ncbi:hypothetical protein C2845_PM02G31500 [Panicum miliaceum]|uniref:Uncharacterized protein n=1 Tax=Panicum miliaceum TaxID=4540 RepID=A0A3L6S9C2_PANMI|nr:hypothetical protein C2845_PM02G31500 [Panicum miliaceum]